MAWKYTEDFTAESAKDAEKLEQSKAAPSAPRYGLPF